MTSDTHSDPFPTLSSPHACMVKLNHSKIIPSILRGICTLSQLYQCRLSVDCITAHAKWAVVAHYFDPPCCHIFNEETVLKRSLCYIGSVRPVNRSGIADLREAE